MATSVFLSLHFRRASVSSSILHALHISSTFFRRHYCRTNKQNSENLWKPSENTSPRWIPTNSVVHPRRNSPYFRPSSCLRDSVPTRWCPWDSSYHFPDQPRPQSQDTHGQTLLVMEIPKYFKQFNINSVNLGWLQCEEFCSVCTSRWHWFQQ